MYICGVDIGGTFTDCVLVSEEGAIVTGKAPSTPADPVVGFLAAIDVAAERLPGGASGSVLGETALLLHGTTVGTNSMIERKGAKVGLIATRGHGDSILIMRGAGRTKGLPVHDLIHVQKADKPKPLVPRSLIREVTERVDVNGEVVVPLDEAEAAAAIDDLVAHGCDAIAIALLWSFKNPAHERRIRELVAERAPGVYVTASSDLLPKRGEYERTTGTVINCFIGPRMASYLSDIEGKLTGAGYGQKLLIMQCAGGVIPADEAATAPILTLSSGPVGGVVGSRFLGDLSGYTNVITTDMGGTTFDVAVIHDGAPTTKSTAIIDQYEYLVPMVDITSIGAGGGSIITVDPRSSVLKVGPESAGAEPGPVAYMRGGTQPTVTDADLVLGLINPDRFLGGRLKLDRAAAERVLAEVGAKLGLSATEVAAGAVAIVELSMAEAIRQVTIQKGYDPRDFVVFAYGGAGPTHAAGYARQLGAQAVVVPLGEAASAWSAFGVASSDLLHVHEGMAALTAPFEAARINDGLAELERGAEEGLLAEGVEADKIALRRSATMRYRLQLHTVEVPLAAGEFDEESARALEDRFHERYEAVYGKGSGFRGAGIELVSFKVVASGVVRRPRIAAAGGAPAQAIEPIDEREVYWYALSGSGATAIYDGDQLRPGHELEGPAIVELPDTTVVVPPGARAHVDAYGNIVINLED